MATRLGHYSLFNSNFLSSNPRMNPLRMAFYKKNAETIPITALAVIDMGWLAFCTVVGFIRTDVVLTRQSKQQGELYDLLIHPRCRKFLHFNQEYPPQPELYDAYIEMEKAQKERNKICKIEGKECNPLGNSDE